RAPVRDELAASTGTTLARCIPMLATARARPGAGRRIVTPTLARRRKPRNPAPESAVAVLQHRLPPKSVRIGSPAGPADHRRAPPGFRVFSRSTFRGRVHARAV